MSKSSVTLTVVVLAVFAAYVYPWYNFTQPTLAGIPFFYWWQIVWYAITTALLLTYTYGFAERTDRRPR